MSLQRRDKQLVLQEVDLSKNEPWLELAFRFLSFGSACTVLLILFGLVVILLMQSYQLLNIKFFVSAIWNPESNKFGGLSAILGTLETSAIGTIVCLPVSFGLAIFLSECSSSKIGSLLGAIVELLAGIPSVIYGMWALFSLVPIMSILQKYISWLPIFAGPPIGMGIFTASIVLAIMMIPFSASVMRDAFCTVPYDVKEAAYGVGATRWEVIRSVIIPATWTGILGSVMLALGRGLGETMAVTFVIGNNHMLHLGLFYPSNTIASTLANEFIEASSITHTHALMALAFSLFVVTFFVVGSSRLMIKRLEKKYER